MTTPALRPGAPEDPGIYPGVPEAVYHGDRNSLSHSGAKLILQAPALYRWALDHPITSKVFDYGHAAHALVLGVGQQIRVIDAADWRTNKAKAERDEAHAAGQTPLLTKDYVQVRAMADELSGHTLAMRLLSDGEPEVSAYALDETSGVLRRCRFDWLGKRVLTDYKTAASADPHEWSGRYGVIRKRGYDMQAAWYLDVSRALDHDAQAFAFIAQEKDPPYLVSVIYVDEEELHDALDRNRQALETFAECRETCEWPGYLPDDTAARVSLIEQTYDEEPVA